MTTSGPVLYGKRTVTFIFFTVLLDMVGFGIIIPVLPQLIEDVGHIGLGDAAVIGGWLFAAFSISQFAFGPLMGNLSDAFGRRPLLLIAVAGLAVDYVLTALAPNLVWLFVGRIIAGGCGASYVIASAYIADVTAPEERAKAFGMMGAAFGIGFVIGPVIGGLLGEFGPRAPFWVAAGLAGLNFLFGYFVLPESLPKEKRRPVELHRCNPFGVLKVFQSYGTVLPLVAITAVFFLASSVYQALWAFWGEARFGWDSRMIGLTLAAFGIITALTQGLLSGPLVKRFGEYSVAVIGLGFAAIACIGYGFAGTLPAVLILLLLHAPEGLVHPMLSSLMSRAVPDDAQGELQGGLSAVTNIAMLAGTILFSQLFGWFTAGDAPVEAAGYPYLVSAALLLIALGMLLRFGRRLPDAPAAAAPPPSR